MAKFYTLLAMVAFSVVSVWGQPYVREAEGIRVIMHGSPLDLPFAGGINSPTHQFVDIDGDGDQDLFILDVDLLIDFYKNEGTQFQSRFRLRTGEILLPSFSRWFLFLDYDADGLIDLCTEDSTDVGVRVYRNIGTPQSPVFMLLIPTLQDVNGNDVFSGQASIPAFADIDADGDLDFFSSNFDGTVNFYRDISSATSPQYQYTTGFWQQILIFGDTCTTTRAHHIAHGASAYRFTDIDGDNDVDLFVGDANSRGVFALRNTGTPSDALMTCDAIQFPLESPVLTEGFNQASFVDIDGDSDLDMFVGVLAILVQRQGFWFLKNTGSSTSHLYQLQTREFLLMIDVGMNARPTFVDLDADVDEDLVIGNLNGQLSYYRNTGTSTTPVFSFIDSVYQGIGGGFAFAPAFADIDNDGDRDLFIGKFDGRISFYGNTGTPQSAVFTVEPSPVDTINVFQNAAPALADIDADGDFDLFAGKGNGRISFYRNIGTASTFLPVLESTSYQNIIAGQNTMPTFFDVDNDGDLDLFIGTSEGRIEFYQNNGTPTTPQFTRITNHYAGTAPTQEAAPAFVDIDGDGDKDLFMGVMKGGLHYYRNDRVVSVGEAVNLPLSFLLLQNYPNPFNPTTRIQYAVPTAGQISLKVFDLLGREVAALVNEHKGPGNYAVSFDAASLSSGVYFYKLSAGPVILMKKLMLLK